jgi:hypothetical protein
VADVLADDVFWKQQAFVLLRYVLGGAMAVLELSLLAGALHAIAEPITYRWEGATSAHGASTRSAGRSSLYPPG